MKRLRVQKALIFIQPSIMPIEISKRTIEQPKKSQDRIIFSRVVAMIREVLIPSKKRHDQKRKRQE